MQIAVLGLAVHPLLKTKYGKYRRANRLFLWNLLGLVEAQHIALRNQRSSREILVFLPPIRSEELQCLVLLMVKSHLACARRRSPVPHTHLEAYRLRHLYLSLDRPLLNTHHGSNLSLRLSLSRVLMKSK